MSTRSQHSLWHRVTVERTQLNGLTRTLSLVVGAGALALLPSPALADHCQTHTGTDDFYVCTTGESTPVTVGGQDEEVPPVFVAGEQVPGTGESIHVPQRTVNIPGVCFQVFYGTC